MAEALSEVDEMEEREERETAEVACGAEATADMGGAVEVEAAANMALHVAVLRFEAALQA